MLTTADTRIRHNLGVDLRPDLRELLGRLAKQLVVASRADGAAIQRATQRHTERVDLDVVGLPG